MFTYRTYAAAPPPLLVVGDRPPTRLHRTGCWHLSESVTRSPTLAEAKALRVCSTCTDDENRDAEANS
jgi:hypothetical protein